MNIVLAVSILAFAGMGILYFFSTCTCRRNIGPFDRDSFLGIMLNGAKELVKLLLEFIVIGVCIWGVVYAIAWSLEVLLTY